MKNLLFFDIDGTLLLTGGCGRIAFEKAFETVFSIRNAWGDTIPHGKTDPLIFQEIALKKLGRRLEQDEYTRLCDLYLESFRDEIWRSPRFRLMRGVPELIKELQKRDGVVLAIVTGNLEETAWLKLEKAGIRNAFCFGAFGSDSEDRGEIVEIALERATKFLNAAPRLNHTYMIGDTSRDIEAARRHGLKTIAVSTGPYSEEDLSLLEPDHVLPDLSDKERFLKLLT